MPLALRIICLITSGLLLNTQLVAQHTLAIDNNDITLTVEVYPAKGTLLYLWLPPEGGFQPAHTRIAQSLNTLGIEVWFIDLFESHFLPPVASSLPQIPASDISVLLDRAQQSNKQIILLGSGRSTLPLLRGARYRQKTSADVTPITGVILLSPQFYIDTPIPGEVAKLHPIVNHTNLPIFLLQPKLSPWFWKLDQTVPALQRSGSDVFVRLLPDVRDRFYYRPDATLVEQELAAKLPRLLYRTSQLLVKIPPKQRPIRQEEINKIPPSGGKKDHRLLPYRGDPNPPPLALQDMQGKSQKLADYRGQVVLVNFWASWCPPCVHEMPSMQRLANKLDPEEFTILAVNMAEDKATINDFLQTRINVQFPVLLDHDGTALKQWGVFAFPTSFVIDKKGNIRYALFGSVEWDSQEILDIFATLLQEH